MVPRASSRAAPSCQLPAVSAMGSLRRPPRRSRRRTLSAAPLLATAWLAALLLLLLAVAASGSTAGPTAGSTADPSSSPPPPPPPPPERNDNASTLHYHASRRLPLDHGFNIQHPQRYALTLRAYQAGFFIPTTLKTDGIERQCTSEFIASLSFAAPWTRGQLSSLVGCTVSYSRQSTPGFIIDTFRHAGTGHPLGGIAVTGLSSPLVTAPKEIYSRISVRIRAYSGDRRDAWKTFQEDCRRTDEARG